MSASKYTEFNLPKNAYAAFDAVSIKQLITNRIKSSGIFPDIDYEGSNISGLVDIVAYTYHVLLFYLNQTASDSLFSQAELFENMNKIVSLIGYKTNGNNTSSLNVTVSADSTLPKSNYTIKRFSNISIRNVTYSFNSDITFQKTLDGKTEYIESIGKNNLLYQGIFKEYPTYTAVGDKFEQLTLNIDYPNTLDNTKMIDQNNIFVFVKDINTEKWIECKEVSSLYLADNISLVFEKRLNEYGHFEIKFGNDINGKQLNTGDSVLVYYLESDGSKGVVGNGASSEGKLALFNTRLFQEVFDDISDSNTNYITTDEIISLKLDNQYSSVPPTYIESVSDIRKNTPLIFSSQNRAVTVFDYTSTIRKNFSNILHDVAVCSNKEYTTDYLDYYYKLGLERPNLDAKLLFNQISFNDACDFNNVYVFCVPRLGAIQNENTPIDLFYAQKQAIIDKLEDYKMITHNVVMRDPIYIGFNIGLNIDGEELNSDIKDETKIRIIRSQYDIISKEQIKSTVFNLIKEFFSQNNNKLGQVLNFSDLSLQILSINGVQSLETVRTVNNVEYKTSKLSFIYWNPLYPNYDVNITSQNLTLEFFQFPFFYEIKNLLNRIEVV
jgi:hypothetical protein